MRAALGYGQKRFQTVHKMLPPKPKVHFPIPTVPRRGAPPALPNPQPLCLSDSDLAINCWILGHKYDPLQVKISRNENVIALKLAIKTTYQNILKNIDAQSLVLYKVSILYTSNL